MTKQATGQIDIATGVPVGAAGPRKRLYLYEPFRLAPKVNADIISTTEATNNVCNRNFEILGAGVAASVDSTLSPGGGAELDTNGTADDQIIVIPHVDAGLSAWDDTSWDTSEQIALECKFVSPPAITDWKVWFGFIESTPATYARGDDDNSVVIDYINTGNFTLAYSSDAVATGTVVDYTMDLGLAPAASTAYIMQISLDADRFIDAFVYEAADPGKGYYARSKHAMKASITANKPVWAQEQTTSTVKTSHLRYMAGGRTND